MSVVRGVWGCGVCVLLVLATTATATPGRRGESPNKRRGFSVGGFLVAVVDFGLLGVGEGPVGVVPDVLEPLV